MHPSTVPLQSYVLALCDYIAIAVMPTRTDALLWRGLQTDFEGFLSVRYGVNAVVIWCNLIWPVTEKRANVDLASLGVIIRSSIPFDAKLGWFAAIRLATGHGFFSGRAFIASANAGFSRTARLNSSALSMSVLHHSTSS